MSYFILFWITCCIASYGLSFAYWTRKFSSVNEYKKDLLESLFISIFGPLSLLGWFLFARTESFKYGFRLW